jgi:hypothetical protein
LELEVKLRAKITRWLGAGCAVAVMCACVSPSRTLGQEAAAGSKTGNGTKSTTAESRTPSSQTSKSQTSNSKRAGARPASPQKHAAAAAAKGSGRSTSQARSHSTSHVAASAHPKSSTSASAHNSKSKYASSRKTGNGKPGNKKTTARGQQKIDSERAQAIQEALIRVHYLDGEPAGMWNDASEEAMRRYQADHGWQSKVVPDSRALISLGLGPSHDHLLNPESAMTTEPAAPHAESLTPTSHSADPGTSVNTPPVAPVATTPPENSSKPQ